MPTDIHEATLHKQVLAFGNKYAPEFRKRVLDLLNTAASEKNWMILLTDLLQEPLQTDLKRYTSDLRKAGFILSTQEAEQLANKLIEEVISQTTDVWSRYKAAAAQEPTQIQATGQWKLTSLTSNAPGLLSSILSTLRERFGYQAFTKQQILEATELNTAGFTGYRKFIAYDKNGRNAALDGQRVSLNQAFQAPPDPQNKLPGMTFFTPKEVMNTQAGIDRFSGSRSRVLYEFQTEDGRTFLRGPRGGWYTLDGRPTRPPSPFPTPKTSPNDIFPPPPTFPF